MTKDGSIAGPKVLEHMVDTVLYFEGESGHAFRIIRSMKNRFGPANEIGVFEMREEGLIEVANPSAYFLAERPEKAPGSVVIPSMEGTRPILIEIQSLVIPTNFGMPRRTTIGVDPNRVSLLVAVLDKICGLHLNNHDIFLNVAGGVKVTEPAIDLGIVSSLASSFLDRPVAADTAVFGEVGLAGEVRGISHMDTRTKEGRPHGLQNLHHAQDQRTRIVRTGSLRGQCHPDTLHSGSDGTPLLIETLRRDPSGAVHAKTTTIREQGNPTAARAGKDQRKTLIPAYKK